MREAESVEVFCFFFSHSAFLKQADKTKFLKNNHDEKNKKGNLEKQTQQKE